MLAVWTEKTNVFSSFSSTVKGMDLYGVYEQSNIIVQLNSLNEQCQIYDTGNGEPGHSHKERNDREMKTIVRADQPQMWFRMIHFFPFISHRYPNLPLLWSIQGINLRNQSTRWKKWNDQDGCRRRDTNRARGKAHRLGFVDAYIWVPVDKRLDALSIHPIAYLCRSAPLASDTQYLPSKHRKQETISKMSWPKIMQ